MGVPTISYSDSMLWSNAIYVDVRSPVEFAKDHIPQALHYPLFDDQQRAYIGTIYHTKGQERALLEGVGLVSLKLKDMISFFSHLKDKQVIIYCYRGGMRSESVVSFCNSLGFSFYKLDGGYKAYRHYIRGYLERYTFTVPIFTLYGLAGSGKTRILKKIPYSIDLENCAGNRSSLFGSFGMPNHTQKYFESLIVQKLQSIHSWPYCIFEGESRKIGNCYIPCCILSALQKGTAIWIETPLEKRTQHIYEEYMPFITEQTLMSVLDKLQSSMGKSKIAYCKQLFIQGKIYELIEFLLLHHYDPEYMHSTKHIPMATQIPYKDPSTTASQIQNFINSMLSS
ncbi:MAG: tRNA 2-selenouridine(34) synthase MnmH [Spirochaetes bacterium]|nr:tRNA 2-selenouridine(34) synthase MnmH [Spirochaetota bacterium]